MSGYLRRLQRAFARAGLRAADPPDDLGRQPGEPRDGRALPGAPGRVGPGRRRHPGRAHRARARRAPHPLVRHGRHHRQDLPDRRRRAAEGPRLRGRPPVALQEGQRHAGAHSRHRDGGDRRRRRLDRPRRRPAAHPGRARQRRRRAGARLLRPRRHRADRDGRRRRPSARSTPRALPAARSRSIRPGPSGARCGGRRKLSGMAAEQAAVGVAEIVDENMANAARVHAVERGVAIRSARWWRSAARRPCTPAGSPRSSAFARIIVPPDAGVGSAVGFLAAPAAYEIVRSRYMRLSTLRCGGRQRARRRPCSRRPSAHARAAAGERPVLGAPVRLHALRRARATRSRLRCRTASWRRPTPPPSARSSSASTRACSPASSPTPQIEIMSWVVLATTATEPPARLAAVAARPAPTAVGERSVFDARLGRRLAVPVFERHHLSRARCSTGPRSSSRKAPPPTPRPASTSPSTPGALASHDRGTADPLHGTANTSAALSSRRLSPGSTFQPALECADGCIRGQAPGCERMQH